MHRKPDKRPKYGVPLTYPFVALLFITLLQVVKTGPYIILQNLYLILNLFKLQFNISVNGSGFEH
jgi:hypothetical protein